MLSPLLFNVYINDLSKLLNAVPAGCADVHGRINHLLYADDLCLMSTSVRGLQQLVIACENYGSRFDIVFNCEKSMCMYFLPFRVRRAGDVYLYGNVLQCVDSFVYLGHLISASLSDNDDIRRQLSLFYVRSNILIRSFSKFSIDVKRCLFFAFCYSCYLLLLAVGCV